MRGNKDCILKCNTCGHNEVCRYRVTFEFIQSCDANRMCDSHTEYSSDAKKTPITDIIDMECSILSDNGVVPYAIKANADLVGIICTEFGGKPGMIPKSLHLASGVPLEIRVDSCIPQGCIVFESASTISLIHGIGNA